jgi:hypothetical protein
MHRRFAGPGEPGDCRLSLQGSKSFIRVETSRHRDKDSIQMTGAAGDLRGRGERGAGQCEIRGNRLGELNTYLRSFPPSHAATADGSVVKHKIKRIRNSDGTFHVEAGAPVRQIADRTIDRRPAPLKGDACSVESAPPPRFIRSSCVGLSILFDLPARDDIRFVHIRRL